MYKNFNIKTLADDLSVDIEKNLLNLSCQQSGIQIINKIEELFDNLNRSDFDKLVNLFITNSLEKENSEEINNRFLDLIECVSETVIINNKQGFTSGSLISIPLTFKSKTEAQFTKITEIIGCKIEAAFKNHNLIKKNAYIAFLPRILGSNEAHAIGFHEARKINHLMSKNDLKSTMQVVVQARLKLDLGFPPPENYYNNPITTIGILAMYVESSNENPFMIFEEAAEQSIDNSDQVNFNQRNRLKMTMIKNEIQAALKVDDLHFEDHNWDWFSQLFLSCEINRIINSNRSFDMIVEQHGFGKIKSIALNPNIDFIEDESAYRLRFYNSANKLQITYHALIWPMIPGETTDECTDAIDVFLKSINLRSIASA